METVEILDMAVWYLRESEADHWYFRRRIANGQRLGQAFFNSLNYKDRSKLANTPFDPFFAVGRAEENMAVLYALDFLTKKEQ